jgi:hypothetical protein
VRFENGTWKFTNDSDAKTLENIDTNPNAFVKDKSATFLMKSKGMNMGIYINPKEWVNYPTKINPAIEYTFLNKSADGEIVGMFTLEKLNIATLKNLKEVLISTIKSKSDYFKLITSEYRTVNNLKILYMRYKINTKGIDFEYEGYYYLNDDGYCGLISFTSQKNFDKEKSKMDSFINCLVEHKLDPKA